MEGSTGFGSGGERQPSGEGVGGPPPGDDPNAWLVNVSDRDKLAAFVVAVHHDLAVVVALRQALFALPLASTPADPELMEAMGDAWAEVQPDVPRIIEAISSTNAVGGLERVGLTGRQLDFKVRAWDRSRQPLLSAFDDADGPPYQSPEPDVPVHGLRYLFRRLRARVPRAPKRAMRRLAKVLGHADVILESLAAVLPVAEPFKEFKQMTEKLAEDTSDGLPDDE